MPNKVWTLADIEAEEAAPTTAPPPPPRAVTPKSSGQKKVWTLADIEEEEQPYTPPFIGRPTVGRPHLDEGELQPVPELREPRPAQGPIPPAPQGMGDMRQAEESVDPQTMGAVGEALGVMGLAHESWMGGLKPETTAERAQRNLRGGMGAEQIGQTAPAPRWLTTPLVKSNLQTEEAGPATYAVAPKFGGARAVAGPRQAGPVERGAVGGVGEQVEGLADFSASPAGLALMGLSGGLGNLAERGITSVLLPKIAHALTEGTFAYEIGSSLPELYAQAKAGAEHYGETGDPEEMVRAVTAMAAAGAFTGQMARGAVKNAGAVPRAVGAARMRDQPGFPFEPGGRPVSPVFGPTPQELGVRGPLDDWRPPPEAPPPPAGPPPMSPQDRLRFGLAERERQRQAGRIPPAQPVSPVFEGEARPPGPPPSGIEGLEFPPEPPPPPPRRPPPTMEDVDAFIEEGQPPPVPEGQFPVSPEPARRIDWEPGPYPLPEERRLPPSSYREPPPEPPPSQPPPEGPQGPPRGPQPPPVDTGQNYVELEPTERARFRQARKSAEPFGAGFPDVPEPTGEPAVDLAPRGPERRVATDWERMPEQELRQRARRMEEELSQAETDPLTKLPGRRAYERHRAENPDAWEASADMDGLKALNDEHGHIAGDMAFTTVGEMLRAVEETTGTRFFRIGGDEFAGLGPKDAMAGGLARVQAALDQGHIEVEGLDGSKHKVKIGVSYGIGADRQAADAALYANKEGRRATRQTDFRPESFEGEAGRAGPPRGRGQEHPVRETEAELARQEREAMGREEAPAPDLELEAARQEFEAELAPTPEQLQKQRFKEYLDARKKGKGGGTKNLKGEKIMSPTAERFKEEVAGRGAASGVTVSPITGRPVQPRGLGKMMKPEKASPEPKSAAQERLAKGLGKKPKAGAVGPAIPEKKLPGGIDDWAERLQQDIARVKKRIPNATPAEALDALARDAEQTLAAEEAAQAKRRQYGESRPDYLAAFDAHIAYNKKLIEYARAEKAKLLPAPKVETEAPEPAVGRPNQKNVLRHQDTGELYYDYKLPEGVEFNQTGIGITDSEGRFVPDSERFAKPATPKTPTYVPPRASEPEAQAAHKLIKDLYARGVGESDRLIREADPKIAGIAAGMLGGRTPLVEKLERRANAGPKQYRGEEAEIVGPLTPERKRVEDEAIARMLDEGTEAPPPGLKVTPMGEGATVTIPKGPQIVRRPGEVNAQGQKWVQKSFSTSGAAREWAADNGFPPDAVRRGKHGYEVAGAGNWSASAADVEAIQKGNAGGFTFETMGGLVKGKTGPAKTEAAERFEKGQAADADLMNRKARDLHDEIRRLEGKVSNPNLDPNLRDLYQKDLDKAKAEAAKLPPPDLKKARVTPQVPTKPKSEAAERLSEATHEKRVMEHAKKGNVYEVRKQDGTPIVRLELVREGMGRGFGLFKVKEWVAEATGKPERGDYESTDYWVKWWKDRLEDSDLKSTVTGKVTFPGSEGPFIRTASADVKFLHPVEGKAEPAPKSEAAKRFEKAREEPAPETRDRDKAMRLIQDLKYARDLIREAALINEASPEVAKVAARILTQANRRELHGPLIDKLDARWRKAEAVEEFSPEASEKMRAAEEADRAEIEDRKAKPKPPPAPKTGDMFGEQSGKSKEEKGAQQTLGDVLEVTGHLKNFPAADLARVEPYLRSAREAGDINQGSAAELGYAHGVRAALDGKPGPPEIGMGGGVQGSVIKGFHAVKEPPKGGTRGMAVQPGVRQARFPRKQQAGQTAPEPLPPGEKRPRLAPRQGLIRRGPAQLRPREIIKFIEKSFGKFGFLPIKTGHYREQAHGITKYGPGGEVIRLDIADDLGVAAHELGHHIQDSVFKLPIGGAAPQYAVELSKLGRYTSSPSMDAIKIQNEGAAEYLRRYLHNPAEAKALAPNYTKAFEAALDTKPKVKEAVLTLQRQIRGHYAKSAVDQVKSKIDFSGKAERKDLKQKVQDTAIAWTQDLQALKDAVETMDGGQSRNVSENAYLLARLSRGAPEKAEGFIEFGWKDKDMTRLGPSLKEALELLPKGTDLEDFSAYLVTKRIVEDLAPRGLEAGIEYRLAKKALADLETPDMIAAAKKFQEFKSGGLEYLVRRNVITREFKNKLEELGPHHAPFHRVREAFESSLGSGVSNKLADRPIPIKRYKGSGLDIIDPIEGAIMDTYSMIDMAEKHEAAQKLVEQATTTIGGARFMDEVPPPMEATRINLEEFGAKIKEKLDKAGIQWTDDKGKSLLDLNEMVTAFTPAMYSKEKGLVTVLDKTGKRRWYSINQPELYDALTMVGARNQETVIKLLQKPVGVLKTGATLAMSFILRNMPRDTVAAALQSKYNFIPGIDSLRGLASHIKADRLLEEFKNSGAGNASLISTDRKSMQEMIRKFSRNKTWRDSIPLNPIHAFRALADASESATRIGLFRKALEKEGRTEEGYARAALEARTNPVDYASGGRSARQWNAYSAFFNPMVQGNVRLYEVFRDHPVRAGILATTLMTLPSMAAAYLNKDDEDYKNIPDWEKNSFWHIPTKEGYVRIPKPYGAVTYAFSNVPEAFLRHVASKDPKALDRLFPDKDTAIGVFISLLPTALLPGFESIANYDTYRKRHIVSPWDEHVDPELQTNRWTSDLAKFVAPKMGLAPAKFDHLINGYTAGLGKMTVSILNKPIRAATGAPAPPKGPNIFQSAFYRPKPSSDAEIFRHFYDRLEVIDGAKRSAKLYREQGNAKKAFEAEQKFDRYEAKRMHKAQKQLSEIRSEVNKTFASNTMDPDEKRKKLNDIYKRMIAEVQKAMPEWKD